MKNHVLITGASRGIGAATAELFAAEGWELTLTCMHHPDQLHQLAERLGDVSSSPIRTRVGDVADPAFAETLFSDLPPVSVLINNAGIAHIGLLQDTSAEDWNRVLSVNLSGPFYMIKAALPGMLREKDGRILNISSVWGNVGGAMETAYSASKGGLNALTKALAKELAPSKIAVNAIAFGCVDTEMNACFSEEERATLAEEIPAGRFATTAEAAEIIFRAAQLPAYVTGQILTADGGWS